MLTLSVVIQDNRIEQWEDYLKTHNVKEVEKAEVGKMLSCKDGSRGGYWYYCKN